MISGVSASASKMGMPTTSRCATTTEQHEEHEHHEQTVDEAKATHPGEMLREDFIPDYGLTVASLAEAVGVSRQSINELLRARRGVRPEMALRLGHLFGNSPEFWMNASARG
jgi:antitoxin HigA-1